MQITPQNVDSTIENFKLRMKHLETRQAAYEEVIAGLNSDEPLLAVLPAVAKLMETYAMEVTAELGGMQTALIELGKMKSQMESNIIVPGALPNFSQR